jgi:hypothetical protein
VGTAVATAAFGRDGVGDRQLRKRRRRRLLTRARLRLGTHQK